MCRAMPRTTNVAAFRFEPRGPLDLFAEGLRVGSDGELRGGPPWTADADWQLAMFHGETNADVPADHWEMRPASEQAVCCVRGALRVHLRPMDYDAPDVVVSMRRGEAVIVPRATWHRIELDEPSDIMSVVVGDGARAARRVTARRHRSVGGPEAAPSTLG
jgi:hypothetical protein